MSSGWLPLRIIVPGPRHENLPIRMSLGAYIDTLGADYAFVLVDNAVRIYSLGSGLQVRIIRPLGMDVNTPIDSLAIADDGKRIGIGCSAIVPEYKSSGLWVYQFKPTEDRNRRNVLAVRTGSARVACTPIEQRCAERRFFLGHDKAGAPSEHANVVGFMQRLALSIVEDALLAAEPSRKPGRASESV